ncbi:MBL fold metallo-hydrolase [Candidatus Pacebacteria bacterium]|nr:MBL fold metallo-hydrolase [Candidatus Paceibacterota bacterium]
MDRILKLRALIMLVLVALGGLAWLPSVSESQSGVPEGLLSVHFLDVGQGDATFIETDQGVQVLIDGGRGSAVLRELGSVMAPNDRTIDIVVATHPDSDHIGGLIDVFARYEVGAIVMTENTGESEAAAAYAAAAEVEGAEIIMARRGQSFTFSTSTRMEVLFPDTDASQMESNTSSIVLKLIHGETSFLLTGDSPKNIEEYLVLLEGENLESDVLKVGHHGSRTSTSELFLAEVDPRYAVISASSDNRYGHPHVEVTDLLFNYRVETYSTAEHGRVTILSDGQTIEVSI